jgi:hypothetical protein
MSFVKKMTFVMLLMVAGSFGAAAQDTAIRFKLAQETRIGRTALAAGTYRMALFNDGYAYALVTAEGGQRSSVIAVPVSSENKACRASSVTLAPAGDGFSIASVCFAEAETAVYFPVASARKSTVAAQTTGSTALAGAE